MKQLLHTFIFLLVTSSIFGQITDVEKLMTRRYLTCWDIEYNVNFLIPEYYEQNQIDTLDAILQYWEAKCGPSEPLTRCKILLAIDHDKFAEKLYNQNILHDLEIFQQTNPDVNAIPLIDRRNYLAMDNLNQFTENLANQLLRLDSLTTVETFFLKIYSRDPFYTMKKLESKEFDDTNIQRYYLQSKKEKERELKRNFGVLAGVWIPQDHLSVVGTHPTIGMRMGLQYRKINANFTMAFKFIKTPNKYTFVDKGITYETNHFFGGYIGLDLGYQLITLKQSNIALIGGIAWDGFDTFSENEKEYDDQSNTIASLNLNAGLGYEFELKSGSTIGIETKYNFLNFKNPGGTDMTGDVVTVNVFFRFPYTAPNYWNRW